MNTKGFGTDPVPAPHKYPYITPEELERMTAHIRGQLAYAGMPPNAISDKILTGTAAFVYRSHRAYTDANLVLIYRVLEWSSKEDGRNA